MGIKIYNSLSRQKEEFNPILPDQVNMYVCGPTVYDVSHIGHVRAAYVFDVIRRYFKFRGFKVNFVRNITDIDDKIINRAKEDISRGREANADLHSQVKKVAEKYTALYEQDMSDFGILPADIQPKATEHINEMIAMIQQLIAKDMAYAVDGDVYFQVRKFPGYGKLSHQSIDQMLSGARVETDKRKKDPLDFALWKKAKPQEPFWDSPWGEGRPGWHIECSVMSKKYLKNIFDIHGGGRDLIFPHHENEIAQAEAASGEPFARYWVHNGLLTVEKEKMAKSLGNFIVLEDVLKKYPADALKIFYLQAHYSSSIDFSWERLEDAKKAYERIVVALGKAAKHCAGLRNTQASDLAAAALERQFAESMDDDFNMPKGLAVLFDAVNQLNKMLDEQKPAEEILAMALFLRRISAVFGLNLEEKKQTSLNSREIEDKIRQRLEYKSKRDFKAADNIRLELQDMGIILEDAKDGKTVWRVA